MTDWMERRSFPPRISLSSSATRMGTGTKKAIYIAEMMMVFMNT